MLARRSESTSVTSFPQNLFVTFSQVLQSNRNPEIKKVTEMCLPEQFSFVLKYGNSVQNDPRTGFFRVFRKTDHCFLHEVT